MYFTLTEAARSVGKSAEGFKKRKDIQALLSQIEAGEIETTEKQVAGRNRVGIPLAAFPADVQAALQHLEETSEEHTRSLFGVAADEAATEGSGAVAGDAASEREPSETAEPSPRQPAEGTADGANDAAGSRGPIPALSASRTEEADRRTPKERTIDAKLELLSSLDEHLAECRVRKAMERGSNVERTCQAEWHGLLLAGQVAGLSAEAWDWVRERRPGLSTVLRWRTLLKKEGVAALADGRMSRAQSVGYGEDEEVWAAVRWCYMQGWNLRQAHGRLVAQFGQERVGTYNTLRRKVRQWEEAEPQQATYFRDPQEWRNKYMVAGGDADADIVRPNQVWQLDATLADVVCGDGRRYYVLGMIDVFSRRCMFRVEKSSSADGQVRLLATAFRKFGKPEQIHTDNGKDYTSGFLARVMRELKIEHRKSTPHSPWQKPYIERLFGTLTRGLFEGMPEFIGHDVAERERIRARQMEDKRRKGKGGKLQNETGLSAAELQTRLDEWVEGYEQRVHGSLGLPPIAQWASVAGWTKTVIPEETLRIVCATPAGKGTARIGKSGILHDGAYYWTTDDAMWKYMGKTVYIRYAGDDLGELLLLDLKTEEPICYAQNVERLGYSQQQWKAQRKAQHKAMRGLRKAVDEVDEAALAAKDAPPNRRIAALTQAQEMTEGLKKEPKRVKREMGQLRQLPTAASAPVENPVVSEKDLPGNALTIDQGKQRLLEGKKAEATAARTAPEDEFELEELNRTTTPRYRERCLERASTILRTLYIAKQRYGRVQILPEYLPWLESPENAAWLLIKAQEFDYWNMLTDDQVTAMADFLKGRTDLDLVTEIAKEETYGSYKEDWISEYPEFGAV